MTPTRKPAISARAVHFRGFQKERRQRVRHESLGIGSPLEISGLVGWYDFSDAASLFTDTARTTPVSADGNTIKGMTDKSGAGNHLSEATNGPTYKVAIQNNKSVGRFDGTNDTLTGGLATTNVVFTMIAVIDVTPDASIQSPFGHAEATTGYAFRCDAADKRGAVFPAVAALVSDAATTNWEIWVLRHSVGASTFYLNGGAAAALTDSTANPLTPGAGTAIGFSHAASGGLLTGDAGEGCLYNRELSLVETNLIGQYLGAKWGITWTTAT